MAGGILFLCVANSARSQMAEGWARRLAPEGIEILSAGSAPAVAVHPLAIEVMREAGVDIAGQRAKSVAEIPLERIGTIVTLCAEEVCPVVPGEVRRLHWPVDDPAVVAGSEAERREAFRRARDVIRERVERLLGTD